MDDNDSLAAFQNPNAVLSSLGQLQNEIKNVEVVTDAHVPNFDNQPPAAVIGPYGKLLRPAGPSPEELQVAEEKVEREHIVSRLTRLNAKANFPTIKFSPDTESLSTLRRLNRLATHTGRLRMSVNFMKRATIFLCRLIEGFCARFPVARKYGVNLNGFSEHLMLTINSFDGILEDLYDCYSDQIVEASPLLIYVGSIGSQMMVYSATRTIMARAEDSARQKREAETREREAEIANLMRSRSNSGGTMSGPGDVSPSELVDTRSVGFESVVTEVAAEAEPKPAPVPIESNDKDDVKSRVKIDLS